MAEDTECSGSCGNSSMKLITGVVPHEDSTATSFTTIVQREVEKVQQTREHHHRIVIL